MEQYSRLPQPRTRVPALILAATFLGGCNVTGVDVAGGALDKISLTGPNVVQVGDTIRLTAVGSVTGLVGLFFVDPIADGRYTVSDPTVASILPFTPPAGDTTSFSSVLVKGLKVGRVNVAVSARNRSDTHPVDVIAAGQ